MKRVVLLIFILLIYIISSAQAPQKISYQAIIRDAGNTLVTSHAIGMRISILQGSPTGTSVYTETQTPTTNSNGLATIEIGGGTLVTGTFLGIDWSNGSYFIKTEIDPTGGISYTITGTSQILSVPYALHAKTAGSIVIPNQTSGDLIYYDGTRWIRLPKGTAGQVLTMSESGNPIWLSLFELPLASTLAASNINTTSASLNGTANDNGLPTTVEFEYGTTTSYGSTITAAQSPISGSKNTSVNANISGLLPNTTFHFRVKAVNSLGTTYGNDVFFKTLGGVPTVTTQAATKVLGTSAQLNGIVNANFFTSTVTFEYGTTTSYGSTITATQSPVTGGNSTNVSVSIIGLSTGTTYHYRVIAVNSFGATYGNDIAFIANYGIGESYGGGIIFYVDGTGQHGLISATSDQGTAIWGCQGTLIGTSANVGTGSLNTTAIINGCTTAGIAAKLCRNYNSGGFNDWYLPSRGELDLLFQQRDVVGGFVTTGDVSATGYWSSTENDGNGAWAKYFLTSSYGGNSKNFYVANVRAIRSF